MNQDIFGGVGNIIKNEVLFETKIHPGSVALQIPSEKTEELLDETINWTESWYNKKKREKKWSLGYIDKKHVKNAVPE